MSQPIPQVTCHQFVDGQLTSLLGLKATAFIPAEAAFRQLRYIEKYLSDNGCRALLIETPYIDRDHIEDHSIFYSKSLFPYPNYCSRVHFFSIDAPEILPHLTDLFATGTRQGVDAFYRACRDFSLQSYLGFSVIKPLQSCPVGRTVLKTLPDVPADPGKKYRRYYGGVRHYTIHFRGVALTVTGLAFQQQDAGVSACATTAIWSALHKARDHEDFQSITPAQITLLASKYALPRGRAFPQTSGLTLDQMCQAVHAVGLAPDVLGISDITHARAYLYAIMKSGFCPVLLLEHPTGGGGHAVATVGMKLRYPPAGTNIDAQILDASGDVLALYIHDDRRGPYLRADLQTEDGCVIIKIPPSHDGRVIAEKWKLTHILVPLHQKIRLSFDSLRRVALKIAAVTSSTLASVGHTRKKGVVTLATCISRPHIYMQAFWPQQDGSYTDHVLAAYSRVSMPRYLGMVQLTLLKDERLDFLIDTTSTERNPTCLGIFLPLAKLEATRRVAELLAKHFECPLLAPGG